MSFVKFARNTGIGISLAALTYYSYDSRAAIHKQVFMPVMRYFLDGEDAHRLSIKLLSLGIAPVDRLTDDQSLKTEIFGKIISNPIGMAAGFDKNAEAIDGLFNLGFGLVEVGSITPQPQPGNPKPRVFRLDEQEAVINRYGFNSDGMAVVLDRLRERFLRFMGKNVEYKSGIENRLLGINLGKNKWSSSDSHQDYVDGAKNFAPFADYLVINVSSPNTPRLRDLQQKDLLKNLISEVKNAIEEVGAKPALVLKVSPDMTEKEIKDVSNIALVLEIDGIIVSNTTVSRPSGIEDKNVHQKGGLSGKPLKNISLDAVRKFRENTQGRVDIVGCGGISSGEDALEYFKAGAKAVQIYTSLTYKGPGVVREIKDQLVEYRNREGILSIGSRGSS